MTAMKTAACNNSVLKPYTLTFCGIPHTLDISSLG